MAADIVSVLGALKTEYDRQAKEGLNNKTFMLGRLQKKTRKMQGHLFQAATRTGRIQSVWSQHQTQTFFPQTAGVPTYMNPKVYPKITMASYEVNLLSVMQMQTPLGSFVDIVADGLSAMNSDVRKDLNRQVFGDGSGYLAKTTGDSDTTTPIALAAHLWGGTTNPGVYLYDNLHVSAIDADKDTLQTGAESSMANGLTVNGNSATELAWDAGTISANAAAKYIGKFGTLFDASNAAEEFTEQTGQKEITGLYATVSNADPICGALYGLAVGSNPSHKSSRTDGSAGITPKMLYNLMYAVAQKTPENAGRPSCWVSNFDVRGQWYDRLVANVRYDASVKNVDLSVGDEEHKFDVPWYADIDCPDGCLFLLNEGQLQIFQSQPMGYLDKGENHSTRIPNTTRTECVLVWSAELYTPLRCAHGMIYDIPTTE